MQITIKYFASIREAIGSSAETITLEPLRAPTVADIRDDLIARGEPYAQALARGKAVRIALDQTMCKESALIHEGCEIAFFPPVTGG
jgi:molybdopterin synthase sulfur carrier subunit